MAPEPPLPGSFGELVRRYREAAGLTQDELAERAALSGRGLRYLERDLRRPYPATVQRLAAALGLDAAQRALFAAVARQSAATEPAQAPGERERAAGEVAGAGEGPLLVGRDRELVLLERHLAGVGPPLLLLAGEPGIGKSRLLHEAAGRAGAAGWTVLQGECRRRGDAEPYAPLLEALRRQVYLLPPPALGSALEGCAWLVRLLPELAAEPIEPLPAWTLSPEQERRLMFEAARRFVANVAGPAGTLLVLDDVQWAGQDALDLLEALLRGPASAPLRVLGAYRGDEAQPGDPLATLLVDLARAERAARHEVPPLPPAPMHRLLDALLADAPLPASTRERLVERAGGVPYFLVSCARELRAGGPDAGVPWDVAESVRGRVAALPEGAREALRVAAVAGREAPRALLAAVLGRPEEEVLAGLEMACRAHLLEEVEEADEGAYRFAHDLAREVIEADLGAGRRQALHRRVAEALEGPAGSEEEAPERLAYHYARGGVIEKAVRYLEAAGDRAAARHAQAAAESSYRGLLERLERLDRPLDAARAQEKLGAVLRTVARYEEALAALEQAAAAYQAAGDREGAWRALAQIGQVHAVRGTAEEGARRLRAALGAADAVAPSHGLAALYAAPAHLYFAAGRTGEHLAAAERAADLARVVGDERILADAQNRRGLALLLAGRMAEALGVLEEALPLAEALGDLDTLARVLSNLSTVYNGRGEPGHARRYAERALAVAEQRGDAAQSVFAGTALGSIHITDGDWTQARAHLERALALSRTIGAPRVVGPPLVLLGKVRLVEGDWDEAARYLEEGLGAAERCGDVVLLTHAHALLAEREILAGRPEAARSRLAPLRSQAGGQGGWGGPLLDVTAAWAALEVGEPAAAEVEQVVTRLRAAGNRHALVEALRVQAMLCMRQARWPEARHALEEGLALARSMRYPYGEGRLLHVYGELHARSGQPELARERLHEALAIFERLGARKDAARVKAAAMPLFR